MPSQSPTDHENDQRRRESNPICWIYSKKSGDEEFQAAVGLERQGDHESADQEKQCNTKRAEVHRRRSHQYNQTGRDDGSSAIRVLLRPGDAYEAISPALFDFLENSE
jgi:hypothetical protein